MFAPVLFHAHVLSWSPRTHPPTYTPSVNVSITFSILFTGDLSESGRWCRRPLLKLYILIRAEWEQNYCCWLTANCHYIGSEMNYCRVNSQQVSGSCWELFYLHVNCHICALSLICTIWWDLIFHLGLIHYFTRDPFHQRPERARVFDDHTCIFI